MRIVSLTCSNTEIVSALGRQADLVGVDDHSDYPRELVARLPRVGPDLDIDVRKVAALRPDLVLASLTVPGHERVIERLEAAGLPYLAPEPVSLEDVYRDIGEIGGAIDAAAEAARVVATMRAELELAERSRSDASRPAILVQWWPKPVIAPGRLSWVHDLIEGAGGRNPLADEAVKSRPIGDPEVVHLEPDAIVLSWCGVAPEKYRPEVVYDNPAFAGVPAVRERQVHVVPEAWLGRPSPRLVDGHRALAKLVGALQRSAATR